jgi:hypothetical protein
MKICPVGAELIRVDRRMDERTEGRTDTQTDMTKLTDAFRNSANAPNRRKPT